MVDRMSKRERLEALGRGDPTDRPAWSLWRHFYDQESSAEGLAEAMVAWQRTYDFDFLKVNPRAQYHVEPWGAHYRYPGGGRRPERVSVPVVDSFDWMRIDRQDPSAGAFAEQLEAIRRIRRELGPDVPMIETIFTPLSVLGDLVETDDRLVRDLRTVPELVVGALEAVTETFIGFVPRCLEAGADGIFFATTQWASYDLVTEEEYARFGRPYDLRVLEAAQDASFNVLHVCGEHSMVFQLADYPGHAVNWAVSSTTTPSLEEAAGRLGRILIGGVSFEALAEATPDSALAEARSAYRATAGRRWVLGADCTVRPNAREGNLRALKDAVCSGLIRDP